jgi:ubiquinone/menaquinone biosynthesis C-methylase UbiE
MSDEGENSVGCCNFKVAITKELLVTDEMKVCVACGGLYTMDQLEGLPEDVVKVAAGSGNPIALAELKRGQIVLDIGCGGGIDCLLAARKVGSEGMVIGIDKSPQKIGIAKRAAQRMGLNNVEFRIGDMQSLPVEHEFIDVVISNCAIAVQKTWHGKERVFKEAWRVLKSGGKLVISDWIAEGFEGKYAEIIQKVGFRNVKILERRHVKENIKAIDVIAYKP